MARRLVRTVRLVGADIGLVCGWQHRSITEGQSAAVVLSSRPTDSQNVPSLHAANKKALARLVLLGAARVVTSLAKAATVGETVRGLKRSIAPATSWLCGTRYVYRKI